MKEKWTYTGVANEDHRMFSEDRQVRWDSVPGSLLLHSHTAARPLLTTVVTVALVLAVAVTAVSQTSTQQRGLDSSLAAVDLVALRQSCGAAEPLKESFQLVQQHACSQRNSGAGQILAFEENQLFIYALADMSSGRDPEDAGGSQKGVRRIRRFFLLKPSTFVVSDLVRAAGAERPIRWLLRSAGEPKIEDGRVRIVEGNTEILGESLLPADASLKKTSRSRSDNRPVEFRVEVTPKQASEEARFLQVFHLGGTTKQDAPARSTVTKGDRQLELTVATRERVFRLTLPLESSSAGKIEVAAADGKSLLPSRLLPSGVMPHGPEGAHLLEVWDAVYRRDRLPPWDVGRPCSHLVKAVEDETFRPGRAIELGCGTGSDAIYLASKGFEVTAVDIAPTALAIAAKKASKAGVKVDWVLADVVALPKLEEFDLIFDRACYHIICQYNSAGYMETLRRLSHRGTRALILAGSPADGGRGGPPRVKEETIRNDFSTLFDFEWVRGIRADQRNPNTKGPSYWSIHLRRKDELKGASELPRSLQEVAAQGDVEAVKSMIARGANVNGREDGFKKTALHRAAMGGHKNVVAVLIAKGAQIDARDSVFGGTALHCAAENGHTEVADLLISQGAGINVKRAYPAADTPLHSAARAGHRDIVELLIIRGADVNAGPPTPLLLACQRGKKDVAELLIDKGADINTKNNNGDTPLHRAARSGQKDVVELLLTKGADFKAKDKRDQTPLRVAENRGHPEIVELLRKHGAKE